MAFEGFTTLTQDTGVGSSFTLAGEIVATPKETINVMIAVDNEHASVVTDDAIIRVTVARDDTPTNYVVESPALELRKTPGGVGVEWLFLFNLVGFKHYKIEWRSAGATDNYTFVGEYRGDGVDI